MENFIEISVPRKNNLKDILMCFAVSVLPILVGSYVLVLVMSAGSGTLLPLAVLLCVGLCYLGYKLFSMFNIEWEYSLVFDELRFSKIINKTRRRDVVTFNISKAEIIARTDDNGHNHQFRAFSGKRYNFTSQTKHDSYYMITTDSKSGKICVLFEPDERMLENFKITARGKFFI